VSTEHLLLGLFREGEGRAFQVLSTFGIIQPSLNKAIADTLGVKASLAQVPPPSVEIKVWLFKSVSSSNSRRGILFIDGKLTFEVDSIVLIQGIPFDRQEAVAASVAEQCGAKTYMIERIR
jgi:hypothetical protein